LAAAAKGARRAGDQRHRTLHRRQPRCVSARCRELGLPCSANCPPPPCARTRRVGTRIPADAGPCYPSRLRTGTSRRSRARVTLRPMPELHAMIARNKPAICNATAASLGEIGVDLGKIVGFLSELSLPSVRFHTVAPFDPTYAGQPSRGRAAAPVPGRDRHGRGPDLGTRHRRLATDRPCPTPRRYGNGRAGSVAEEQLAVANVGAAAR
jgi:hypothetical protein